MEGWRRSRLRLALGACTCDFTGSGRDMLDHSRWDRFTMPVDFVCVDKDTIMVSIHFYSISHPCIDYHNPFQCHTFSQFIWSPVSQQQPCHGLLPTAGRVTLGTSSSVSAGWMAK